MFFDIGNGLAVRAEERLSGMSAGAYISAVSAADLVSLKQTPASTIFRFIRMNDCDTYVHIFEEALYVCGYIPGR